LEFNVVVKLKEEELSRLADALKVTHNLVEKVQLEKAVAELQEQKEKLFNEVEELKDEKKRLSKACRKLENHISNLRVKKRLGET